MAGKLKKDTCKMVANSDDDKPENLEESVNTQQKAVSLKYDKSTSSAPTVTGKGRGWIAEKIIELAKEHDIPIQSDADLVEILDKVEIDQEIPLEVYAVVAEIFSYIYRVNKEKKAT